MSDETLPITESHIAYKKIVHVVLHKIRSCLLEQKKFPCQSQTVMFIDFQILVTRVTQSTTFFIQ